MALRVLVVFGREPRREARDKGLTVAAGERLFEAFAKGWIDAAIRCGARVFVSTPAVDVAGWRRSLPAAPFETVEQRGNSLGPRLENAARQALPAGGCVVVVGGDVAPSERSLEAAFALREASADAVIAPSRDGGVSLVSLREEDLDLLGHFVPRGSDVFARLCRALSRRSRRVAVVASVGDVDGRRELGRLMRTPPFSASKLKALARAVLAADRWKPSSFALPSATAPDADPQVSRGPPLAA